MRNNCYWRADGGKADFAGLPLEEWQKLGRDDGSRVADPLFVDPEGGDYRLRPESPAFRLGFRPIDTEQIGLQGKYRAAAEEN